MGAQGILDLFFIYLQGRSDVCTTGSKVRLEDHWLKVQRERLRGVARAERCCPRCPGVVEDEMHIMVSRYTQGRGSGSCLHVGVLWPATHVCARP